MIHEKSLQILFVLGIGIVILSLMGTAVLANTGTNIDLWVQDIGWGEGDIASPVQDGNASIEIILDTTPGENPITFVSACGFHSDEDIAPGTQGLSDGLVICKILNIDDNAIAEGSISFTEYTSSDTLIININQPIFEDAANFDNFYDARIVIEAPI